MKVAADTRLQSARTRLFPACFRLNRSHQKGKQRNGEVNSLAFQVVFVLLSFCFLCETVIGSKDACIVCCGKKSQNILFRSSASYFNDLEACFGFNPIDVNAADISEGCRRAVQEYRSTGKIFHHVSVACQFLFSRKHFTTVRLT